MERLDGGVREGGRPRSQRRTAPPCFAHRGEPSFGEAIGALSVIARCEGGEIRGRGDRRRSGAPGRGARAFGRGSPIVARRRRGSALSDRGRPRQTRPGLGNGPAQIMGSRPASIEKTETSGKCGRRAASRSRSIMPSWRCRFITLNQFLLAITHAWVASRRRSACGGRSGAAAPARRIALSSDRLGGADPQ